MTKKTVGIIFGGKSTEHHESIRATRILYQYAIEPLEHKYRFKYFYLTKKNQWATANDSFRIIQKQKHQDEVDPHRICDLHLVDVLYSTCMGGCGENGNLAGLADIFQIPLIGCGILPSALCLDKPLTKLVAEQFGIPTVKSITVNKDENVSDILSAIDENIGYPLFAKPTNLGTCAYVFKATSEEEFRKKWAKSTKNNDCSPHYLIEQFIPNIEVRVFIYQDAKGEYHLNDGYVTTLKEEILLKGGSLFKHLENSLEKSDRKTIRQYAIELFEALKIKDYARIDFFIDSEDGTIYFNEANTQPFLSTFNIKLMKKDGLEFSEFLDLMIQKNLKA